MKDQNFPALVILTIWYCIGFAFLATIYTVFKVIEKSTKKSSVVDAKTLAPIFEESPIEFEQPSIPAPYAEYIAPTKVTPIRKNSKKKTMADLISDEYRGAN